MRSKQELHKLLYFISYPVVSFTALTTDPLTFYLKNFFPLNFIFFSPPHQPTPQAMMGKLTETADLN
ncbi:hypothetical protein ACQP3L_39480, partial [Escherichia coli]